MTESKRPKIPPFTTPSEDLNREAREFRPSAKSPDKLADAKAALKAALETDFKSEYTRQSDRELLEKAFAAFDAGNFNAILQILPPDKPQFARYRSLVRKALG